MARNRFIAVTCLALVSAAVSQQVPGKRPLPWTVLTDPVCPVASFYGTSAPNATKEMRVFYFPQAKDAKLRDAQSLTLVFGYNFPGNNSNSTFPFTRKDDHWETLVPLGTLHAVFAIFYVKDEQTGAIDENGGQLWDVLFCSPKGEKDANSVLRQAQSYTGVSWGRNLFRSKDYSKAVSILEAAQSENPRVPYWFNDLWTYRAERDGGDPKAWAKLAKELAQYLADHPNDPAADLSVGNFIVWHQDKLPVGFVDKAIEALDGTQPGGKHKFLSEIEYSRAIHEADARKRLVALNSFIEKYPDAPTVPFAYESLFSTFTSLGDVAGAEASFARYRELTARNKDRYQDPNAFNAYFAMARLYIDKKTRLEEALSLVDAARDAIDSKSFPDQKLPESFLRYLDHQTAELRAKAYLALKKPSLALPQAQKAMELNEKDPESHFVLAQAFAATRQDKKALDQYFEAALLPSSSDLLYGNALRKFYIENRFGNVNQFNLALEKRKKERFLATKYTPAIVDKPAPDLEFSTLNGEKFDTTALKEKCVVVNFWSPG